MVRIEASVNIQAEPDSVFSLITDVARKTHLDPSSTVLGIAKETEGPVDVGVVFHYRIVIEGKIADYRSRCIAFEAGHIMETASDSSPPFRVRVTVDPIPGGARLTQAESFSLSALRVPVPKAKGWPGQILQLILGRGDCIVQSPESVAAEEAQMEAKLRPRLARWLNAIKTHLERERLRLGA
jgi:hypothetical protein